MTNDLQVSDPGAVALAPEPAPPPRQPQLGARGWLRWMWRQLTSMRTALLLLLLVAVAAIPGSVFPQRDINPPGVAAYLRDHPTWAPWADRLQLFDVFTSPWFSAIYLLLVISLVGCIVPRTRLHWRALRGRPPRVPRHLARLSEHRCATVDEPCEQVAARATALLRSHRYRLREEVPGGGRPGAAAGGPVAEGAAPAPAIVEVAGGADTTSGTGRASGADPAAGAVEISGESGYLRETGNLLFHVGVVVVIIALAWGYLVGWKADRIVPVGSSVTNSLSGYDTFAAGPLVDTDALQPFRIRLDSLQVRFEEDATGAQFGAARHFSAETTVTLPDGRSEQRRLAVNAPLKFGDSSVYLLGNGYAPVITVRDAAGRVLYRQATPFLPQDGVYTSAGAVKVVGARPKQLGFSGLFLPTAYDSEQGPASAFPDARNPALVLTGWVGELMPDGPQSVYTLNTSAMKQLRGSDGKPLQIILTPGQTVTLPDRLGSITFDRVERWAGLSTRYDPARPLALGSGLVCLLGLLASLLVRRRRVFLRIQPVDETRCRVELGALARGEDALLGRAVDELMTDLEGREPVG